MQQARATRIGLGLPNLPLAAVPGHVGVQSAEELRANVLDHTLAQVIDSLTRQPAAAADAGEPAARDIVCTGTTEEIDEFFYNREWSDGLPFVPPTIAKVERFLEETERAPDEIIGVMLPDSRAATVWNVAVNGVMAGCRPETMPVLLALAEAMCDPAYGVEHSGNTPGADTVIVLNGPVIKRLGFNYEQGVMRDGFRANTTVGRFWRLYLRNVAGFLLHKTDKACFGNTWRVAIAENEDVLAEIGWPALCADLGLANGGDAVTIGRYTGGDVSVAATGTTPEAILDYVADAVRKQSRWQLVFTAGLSFGLMRPLILLSPILARTIAAAGWSKADVRQYLYDHTFIAAREFDRYIRDYNGRHESFSLDHYASLGKLPAAFTRSRDRARQVPIVFRPEDFLIAVTGDPLRNNFYSFASNGYLGFPVSKAVGK